MKNIARASLALGLVLCFAALPARAAEPEFTVHGIVTGVSGSIVSLLGGGVRLDAATAAIYNRATGATLGIADIVPGSEIRATIASTQPDGTLVAASIGVGRPEAVELHGALQAVDAALGTLTLRGLTISTNASTTYSGETARGPVAGLSDLAAGDLVEVSAARSTTGLVALNVHAERGPIPPPAERVSFRGMVESQSPGSWVIAGRTVSITSQTRIVGNPAVGDLVHVHAVKRSDGSLLALEIEKEGETEHPEPVTFTGPVVSQSATSWVVGDKTLAITNQTRIEGSPIVGDTVRVAALKAADGSLTAIAIAKQQAENTLEFRGVVQSKGATSWTISGRIIAVTPATQISGNPQVGDTVEVRAIRTPNNLVVAISIRKQKA